MRPLPTPEEMARADRAAIEAGTPQEVLMERAGRAVARAAIRVAGGRYGRRAAVVCGKGNNGGDGLVVARVLRREGLSVLTFLLADPHDLTGAPAYHLERLRNDGGYVDGFRAGALSGVDVIVDAVFGTGFRGTAEGQAAAAIAAVNTSGVPVVAVDIPSGVNGESGSVGGSCIRADVTVAMAAEKLGTASAPGAGYAGVVEVADIGIAVEQARAFKPEAPDVARRLPVRPPDAHKRDAGSVVILAGGAGMSGAALLAARGAQRMGAGYVTLGTTAYVDKAKAAVLPEVLSQVASDSDVLGPPALERMSDAVARSGCVAVGPGIGRGDAQRRLVEELLDAVSAPLILDADALNVLAEDTTPLRRRGAPAVITPHPGEISRLLGISTGDVQSDRVGAARRAAADFRCVVVLKGFRTVVADPGGTAFVNTTGGPELASAGTGDVLTGAVSALVAAGLDPVDAAWSGVFVHGVAGQAASAAAGATGVVAWDVAEGLADAALSVLRASTLAP